MSAGATVTRAEAMAFMERASKRGGETAFGDLADELTAFRLATAAEFAAREASLVEALERIAHETRRRQLPLTSLIYDLATTALTARAHTTSEAPDA